MSAPDYVPEDGDLPEVTDGPVVGRKLYGYQIKSGRRKRIGICQWHAQAVLWLGEHAEGTAWDMTFDDEVTGKRTHSTQARVTELKMLGWASTVRKENGVHVVALTTVGNDIWRELQRERGAL